MTNDWFHEQYTAMLTFFVVIEQPPWPCPLYLEEQCSSILFISSVDVDSEYIIDEMVCWTLAWIQRCCYFTHSGSLIFHHCAKTATRNPWVTHFCTCPCWQACYRINTILEFLSHLLKLQACITLPLHFLLPLDIYMFNPFAAHVKKWIL